jgi:hypothetical protein
MGKNEGTDLGAAIGQNTSATDLQTSSQFSQLSEERERERVRGRITPNEV